MMHHLCLIIAIVCFTFQISFALPKCTPKGKVVAMKTNIPKDLRAKFAVQEFIFKAQALDAQKCPFPENQIKWSTSSGKIANGYLRFSSKDVDESVSIKASMGGEELKWTLQRVQKNQTVAKQTTMKSPVKAVSKPIQKPKATPTPEPIPQPEPIPIPEPTPRPDPIPIPEPSPIPEPIPQAIPKKIATDLVPTLKINIPTMSDPQVMTINKYDNAYKDQLLYLGFSSLLICMLLFWRSTRAKSDL